MTKAVQTMFGHPFLLAKIMAMARLILIPDPMHLPMLVMFARGVRFALLGMRSQEPNTIKYTMMIFLRITAV